MSLIDTVVAILNKRVDTTNLKPTDKLSDIGLDSLDLVEVMIEIEEELHIEFSSDEIARLTTLEDVVKLIETKNK